MLRKGSGSPAQTGQFWVMNDQRSNTWKTRGPWFGLLGPCDCAPEEDSRNSASCQEVCFLQQGPILALAFPFKTCTSVVPFQP